VNHSRARTLLSAYLERDLSEAQRAAVEAHVGACPSCAVELEELRGTVALLRRLPSPEPPAYLASRVMARIADGEAQPSGWWRWLSTLAAPALAAPLAAAAAAVAVSFWIGPPGAQPRDRTAEARGAPAPALVPRLAGPVEPADALARVAPEAPVPAPPAPLRPRWRGGLPERALPMPYHLARSLRGAGHPHSTALAAHFEGPPEAVVATWSLR
jgi:anti-sigma factor RsiW